MASSESAIEGQAIEEVVGGGLFRHQVSCAR